MKSELWACQCDHQCVHANEIWCRIIRWTNRVCAIDHHMETKNGQNSITDKACQVGLWSTLHEDGNHSVVKRALKAILAGVSGPLLHLDPLRRCAVVPVAGADIDSVRLIPCTVVGRHAVPSCLTGKATLSLLRLNCGRAGNPGKAISSERTPGRAAPTSSSPPGCREQSLFPQGA